MTFKVIQGYQISHYFVDLFSLDEHHVTSYI